MALPERPISLKTRGTTKGTPEASRLAVSTQVKEDGDYPSRSGGIKDMPIRRLEPQPEPETFDIHSIERASAEGPVDWNYIPLVKGLEYSLAQRLK